MAQPTWVAEVVAQKDNVMKARWADYARLTIPSVWRPHVLDPDLIEKANDYQSVGAMLTRNLVAKMAIVMFNPVRPFFRARLSAADQQAADQMQIPAPEVQRSIAVVEQEAIQTLDALGQRPKLYRALEQVVVLGNTMLIMDDPEEPDDIRIVSVDEWAVRRSKHGRVINLARFEEVRACELDDKVRQALPPEKVTKLRPNDTVRILYAIEYKDKKYDMRVFVDDEELPAEFSVLGKKSLADFGIHLITWKLEPNADYGTGLIEEFIRDIKTLSVLSQASIEGILAGMEVFWWLNPNSVETIHTLANRRQGQVMSGTGDDLKAVSAGNDKALEVGRGALQEVIGRLSRAFLMTSAAVRDAERVTAEEIRLLAQELESMYGGDYAALATSLQRPVAQWLLRRTEGLKDVPVIIVTGLEALSRSAAVDNLVLAFTDVQRIMQAVPPSAVDRVKFQTLVGYCGSQRGAANASDFIMDDASWQQYQQAMAQQRVAESNATAAGEAAASTITQQ